MGGRTIFVHAEQALGDTIQFVRYLALVKQQGGTVVFECPRPLLGLLQNVAEVDHLIARGDELPGFDVHAPLLSLPRIFKSSLATIPADVPYLAAEPTLVEYWKKQLDSHEGFKVGICWQGNPQLPLDCFRSFPVCHFVTLAGIPGITLVSLQKGHGVEQLESLDDSVPVIDLSSNLDEQSGPFMDTAAVMMNLDLVVTCDTAIVHLAGALGVPVWLAAKFSADWRWLRDREDSPWYPTMRLFRQPRLGDWAAVFGQMKAELQQKLQEKPSIQQTPDIQVAISAGELIDKITILEIKQKRITDPEKSGNIQNVLAELNRARDLYLDSSEQLTALTSELKAVNERLWDVEDTLRECEQAKDFGSHFIELARSVYRHNDQRAALKRRIDELLGSNLLEEKSYTPYE